MVGKVKRASNFVSMEEERVVRVEMSFGGKRCHVEFFLLIHPVIGN